MAACQRAGMSAYSSGDLAAKLAASGALSRGCSARSQRGGPLAHHGGFARRASTLRRCPPPLGRRPDPATRVGRGRLQGPARPKSGVCGPTRKGVPTCQAFGQAGELSNPARLARVDTGPRVAPDRRSHAVCGGGLAVDRRCRRRIAAGGAKRAVDRAPAVRRSRFAGWESRGGRHRAHAGRPRRRVRAACVSLRVGRPVARAGRAVGPTGRRGLGVRDRPVGPASPP